MKGHFPASVVLLSLIGVFALASGFRLARTESATIVVPDDFLTIQEAINNAVDGDTIFVRTGVYYEHVVVNKTVSLVGEDASTTIIDANDTGHAVHVIRNNVTITGFELRNAGHTQMPDLDAGICLNSTIGCVVSGNRIIDNGFSGIQLLYSQYNTVTGNNLSGNEWTGIHMMGSSRNEVFGNILEDNSYIGIGAHAASHYNNITGNVISSSVRGMNFHDFRYNVICRNNISAMSVEGIEFQDTVSYNTVTENNFVNCTTAIYSYGPNTDNVFSANFITGATYGIKILNAQSSRIANNTIVNNNVGSDSWRAGIRLDGGGYSQIQYNNISGNHYGVLLYSGSPYVSVFGNNISSNEFGLRVASWGSGYLNATKNVVTNNIGYGIGLTGFGGSSNYATVSRNIIANNSDGIALGQYSNYNTILQNNISQNHYGLYIEYSTQNTIQQNNIVDNGQQVYLASGSSNTWNNGYPAGGNYWSNYTGGDVCRGLNQNLPGSDGLGDSPHIINANNLDHYPIMEPWSWAPSDIAIGATTLSKNVVGQGYSIHANVTVTNQGIYTETFNVTLYANTTTIETREVVLPTGNSATLTFAWNTSSFTYGNYITWACAGPVPGEADTVDNTYVARVAIVTILGDVDGDREVDIFDIVRMAGVYGVEEPDPRYESNCDVDCDGDIDIFDVVKAAGNYGKSW